MLRRLTDWLARRRCRHELLYAGGWFSPGGHLTQSVLRCTKCGRGFLA